MVLPYARVASKASITLEKQHLSLDLESYLIHRLAGWRRMENYFEVERNSFEFDNNVVRKSEPPVLT